MSLSKKHMFPIRASAQFKQLDRALMFCPLALSLVYAAHLMKLCALATKKETLQKIRFLGMGFVDYKFRNFPF